MRFSSIAAVLAFMSSALAAPAVGVAAATTATPVGYASINGGYVAEMIDHLSLD